MPLSSRDRAFLGDLTTTGWMQHFLTVASLKHQGAEPKAAEERLISAHNMGRNLAFSGRTSADLATELPARIQALATLRIFQEYVAAMETLGAFLRAIRLRGSGGLLYRNFEYRPGEVGLLFNEVLAARKRALNRFLNLPTLNTIRRIGGAELYKRVHRLLPFMRKRLREAAKMYTRPKGIRLVSLARAKKDVDVRHYVYVFVEIAPEHGQLQVMRAKPTILTAYNKLKHGFNATCVAQEYRAEARAARGIRALQISKDDSVVDGLGTQVELLGFIVRELARTLLDLDRLRLL